MSICLVNLVSFIIVVRYEVWTHVWGISVFPTGIENFLEEKVVINQNAEKSSTLLLKGLM